MTIEEVKTEYYRIVELLGKKALTGDQYNLNCKKGYSVFMIKRDLGLSYNQMKDEIGTEKATSANNKGGTGRNKKIHCGRGRGQMIGVKDCLVNPMSKVCQDCPDKQLGNVQASSDTLTEEEDKEFMIAGTWGSSAAIAVNEGHCEL